MHQVWNLLFYNVESLEDLVAEERNDQKDYSSEHMMMIWTEFGGKESPGGWLADP